MGQSSTTLTLEDLFDAHGEIVQLQPGETLLEPGTAPPGIWLIKSGSVRSLAQVPPSRQWRTIERHNPGQLVGWLSLLHGRPIEHLRAAETSELLFLPAADFERLFESQPELSQWYAQQTPAIEAVHLLQQLAHADQGRSRQLEQWQQLLPQLHWLVDQPPGLEELDLPGHWYRPDASLWSQPAPDRRLQQRLIWLPDPELEATRAAFQAEFDDLVRPATGSESAK